MKPVLLVVLATLLSSQILFAERVKDKASVTPILKQFMRSWNLLQNKKIYELFHPDSDLAKGLLKKEGRAEIDNELVKAINVHGEMKSIELGKYSQDLGTYKLHFTYDKVGEAEGFIAFKKFKGKYLIFDIDID